MLRQLAWPALGCFLAGAITNLLGGRTLFESAWGWIGYGFMFHGVLTFLEQVRRFLLPPAPEPPRRDWYTEALEREPAPPGSKAAADS